MSAQLSATIKFVRRSALIVFVLCSGANNILAQDSLYQPMSYQALVADHRAHEVGDSLVVLVYESATATNQANTKLNKSSNLSVGATDNHNTVGGKFNSDSDAEGGGIERRMGEVIARVSVTVTQILPSGELVVSGSQHIALNSESQTITVQGRVRPKDIDSNNTVLSTRIADADIEFRGHGLLSSRESPGIFTRIFNWLF